MHHYFQEIKQTLAMIQDKESSLMEDLGRDQQSVFALQRMHKAFEVDLQPLGEKVFYLIHLFHFVFFFLVFSFEYNKARWQKVLLIFFPFHFLDNPRRTFCEP